MAGPQTIQIQLPTAPTPPNLNAAFGMDTGQTIPSTAGEDIGSLYKQFNLSPTPPTAQPYVAAPSQIQPRIHQPIMGQTNAPTNRQGITNQATSTKQARRQNRFANITNAINTATNAYKQQKFEDLKTDITNLSVAQQNIDNAQAVLNDKSIPDNDPAKVAAKKSLDDNTQYRDSQLKDDKKRKVLAKAYDISFVNPTENNGPENAAMIAAQKEAQARINSGHSANTPQEDYVNKFLASKDPSKAQTLPGVNQQQPTPAPNVSQMRTPAFNPAAAGGPARVQQGAPVTSPPAQPQQPSQAAQMASTINNVAPTQPAPGSYGNQFGNAVPRGIMVNPQYEAQVAQYQAQQKYVTQYVLPKLIDQITKNQQTKMLTDEHMRATYMTAVENNYKVIMQNFTDLEKAQIEGSLRLQGIREQNAKDIQDTRTRANVALQIAGLADAKGNPIPGAAAWKAAAGRQSFLASYSNQIKTNADANKTLSDQNNAMIAPDKEGNVPTLSADDQRKYDENQHAIAMNNATIDQLVDNRQKDYTRIFGQPLGTSDVPKDDPRMAYYAPGKSQPAGQSNAATSKNNGRGAVPVPSTAPTPNTLLPAPNTIGGTESIPAPRPISQNSTTQNDSDAQAALYNNDQYLQFALQFVNEHDPTVTPEDAAKVPDTRNEQDTTFLPSYIPNRPQ